MAFDFYFAGTQCSESTQLLIDINANVLKSYANDKKELLTWFEAKKNGWKGKLLIDSGAFTVHRQGGSINIDEYIEWLNTYDEYYDYAIELDHIPGKWGMPRTTEEVEYSAKITYENYLYMLDRVKSPSKIMPVFHMGENFENLYKFLAIKDLTYLCISGRKDLTNKQREEWYTKCFNIIKECNRQDIKIHLLGSATMSNAEKFPLTSMDATSWIMTGANGNVLTDYGAIYVGDECKTLRHKLPEEAVAIMESICDKYGLKLEDLGKDYKARMLFNIYYTIEKSRTVCHKPSLGLKKRSLF